MKVFKGLGNLVLAACLVCCGLFAGVNAAYALDESPDYYLKASPTSIRLNELKPGETVTEQFRVLNGGAKDFEYELSAAPYSVSTEQYKEDFATETKYNDIAKWITFSKDKGSLAAGDTEEIEITVKVPKDVPAGGQYAAILVKMVAPGSEQDGGVGFGTEQQVGIIVYADVDGQTRKEGSISDVKVNGFLFNPPITATSVVENTGNVHAEATYILQVYPLFGGEEVYTNEEQPEVRVILPETRRFNQISWDGAPQLGAFRVKQTVKFLGKEEVVEKMVFLCPLWFLFIILVLIFLIVFWIVSRVRGRKE